ncbi:GerAB/ArcD/ProY family transporter [Paenibacillus sacheonensis]|uniref:Endospore germination permease n=1 Tax=Paenibacillus sacheonensis TaxID=742054 RepID=A0A7X4YN49_9BACL|nr:endospore germination permease [Paenibacillus sacheonensis]MBM7564870.1 spore germination protein KB [Paenibacillus sacheonensis]NBC69418.1 endospore germination permease [Paenibacillus sacheonensis]
MQTSEKITSTQMGYLMFTFIVSTNMLTVPSIMVMFGKQNAWMSIIPAAATGLITIWVMIALGNRYPGLTITQYSTRIVGTWLGKLVAVNYIYYWFVSISTITMQHTGFISTLLLPKSPSLVINATFMILCGLAAAAGIEVIGRTNEFLTLLILVFLLPLLILTALDANPQQLKPVLGGGIVPVLQAAISPAGGFMNQLFLIGWLLPYMNKPQKARKVSLLALLGITCSSLFIVSLTIMVLGPLTGKLTYSFLSVVQYIGIEGSFERLEAIAVSMWVLGCFVKVSVSLFILCLCISQLFDMKHYREIVLPTALLSIIGAVWIFSSAAELLNYLVFTFPLLAFFNQTLLPLLLLMIDTVKRKVRRSLF